MCFGNTCHLNSNVGLLLFPEICDIAQIWNTVQNMGKKGHTNNKTAHHTCNTHICMYKNKINQTLNIKTSQNCNHAAIHASYLP